MPQFLPPHLSGIEVPPPLAWWLDCYTLAILVILYVTGFYFIRSDARSARWSLRVGGTVFVGSFLFGVAWTNDLSSRSILQLLGGALFLGAAIVLALWHLIPFAVILFRPLDRSVRRLVWRIHWRLTARQRREEQLRQALYDRQTQVESFRRERAEQERENRLRIQQASDARRRDEARAKAELFYALHGQSLGERFAKSTFDDFVQRYFGDDRPADDVERRSSQLIDVMQRQLDHCAPKPKKSPLDELLHTRKEQSERLKHEDLPDDLKETLDALLQQQLYDKLQRAMEEDL